MKAREFFRPRYRRVLAVLLAAAWTLIEVWRGSILWALLGALTTALAYWEFFGSGEYEDRDAPPSG